MEPYIIDEINFQEGSSLFQHKPHKCLRNGSDLQVPARYFFQTINDLVTVCFEIRISIHKKIEIDPDIIQNIVSGFQKFVKIFTDRGLEPIVLCSPNTRIYLRKILEKFFPNVAVLSYNEIIDDTNIKSLGMLVLKDAD